MGTVLAFLHYSDRFNFSWREKDPSAFILKAANVGNLAIPRYFTIRIPI